MLTVNLFEVPYNPMWCFCGEQGQISWGKGEAQNVVKYLRFLLKVKFKDV